MLFPTSSIKSSGIVMGVSLSKSTVSLAREPLLDVLEGIPEVEDTVSEWGNIWSLKRDIVVVRKVHFE